jgi:hypothetical protein
MRNLSEWFYNDNNIPPCELQAIRKKTINIISNCYTNNLGY